MAVMLTMLETVREPSPLMSSSSLLQNPPYMKIKGKNKKGKVMMKRRTKARREEIDMNLNSKMFFFPPTLIGKMPVQNNKLAVTMLKYLKQPVTCSNPAYVSSSLIFSMIFSLIFSMITAGLTFLILTAWLRYYCSSHV